METSPRPDAIHAVATFFREDPARILTVASTLRGPDRAVESTVEGMSMGRALPAGCRIRIELTDRPAYAVGEVIAFVAGGQVIVHRVVHRPRWGGGRDHLVTRGDATLAPDRPVLRGAILGAVTGVRREGRWLAVDAVPRRSLRARVARVLLLVAVTGTLRLSPRAAQSVASFFQRLEKPLRERMWRKRRGRPRDSTHSSAA